MIVDENIGKNLSLKQCRHGLVLYRTNDMYVGKSLNHYGEFSVGESELFRSIITPDMMVIDAGANIGVHTLEMSRMARVVIAVEMERQLHQMLCANVALNNCVNVVTINAALGAEAGSTIVPGIDFNVDGNFGCLSAKGHSVGDKISIVTIDDMNLSSCGFIKIDVEGMEADVIEGGRFTIKRFKPVLYVENDRKENSDKLLDLLLRLGYRLYWHFPPLFNPDNWNKNKENVFGGVASLNVVCFPDDREFTQGARITEPTSWWEELVVVHG